MTTTLDRTNEKISLVKPKVQVSGKHFWHLFRLALLHLLFHFLWLSHFGLLTIGVAFGATK